LTDQQTGLARPTYLRRRGARLLDAGGCVSGGQNSRDFHQLTSQSLLLSGLAAKRKEVGLHAGHKYSIQMEPRNARGRIKKVIPEGRCHHSGPEGSEIDGHTPHFIGWLPENFGWESEDVP